jgi:hypothetical protein
MTVDSVNRTIQELCGQIRDVSTCEVEAVTFHSLKCRTQSETSNLGQTSTFRLNVLLSSSWSQLVMVLCHWLYVQSSVMVLSRLRALTEGHRDVCGCCD